MEIVARRHSTPAEADQRRVSLEIQRVPRMPVFRQAKTLRSELAKSFPVSGTLAELRSIDSPSANDDSTFCMKITANFINHLIILSSVSQIKEREFVEFLRVGRPVAEEIQHDQTSAALALGKADAPTNGWIIERLVSG